MSLSIGIIGLPNVGKSTLFNALTEKSVPAENYPFCTIDPSVGLVGVPDERLELLSKFSNSVKTIPSAVEFVDIAGIVKGASLGEGLGNKFLSHIREVDVILHVIRIFEDDNIIHVNGSVDPVIDLQIINSELILADLQTITKRKGNIEKDVKRGDKEAVFEKSIIEKFEKSFSSEERININELSEKEITVVKNLHLLSTKPTIYVFNKKIGANNLDEIDSQKLKDVINFVEKEGGKFIIADFGMEGEIRGLKTEEKKSFRYEIGSGGSGLDDLIKIGFETLGLISFFTTGEAETRAWTIKKNSTAPESGAAIHSDFKDKFIKADVIFWKDLLDAGSYSKAREKGLIRTEGKEYIVSDGDVIEFKI